MGLDHVHTGCVEAMKKRLPYPYRMEQGRVVLGFRERKAIRAAFEVLRVLGGYKEAARVFNVQGFETYHGAKWTTQSARAFCQNPIHAGYLSRNGWVCRKDFPDPPVKLEEFLDANPALQFGGIQWEQKETSSTRCSITQS